MEHAMKSHKPLSPDQVKARFRARGQSVADWARQRGWSVNQVYRVLNGQYKGYWGRSHEIAVALGLKVEPSTALVDANSQNRQAA
jgi:gp16 family phage-associated protein